MFETKNLEINEEKIAEIINRENRINGLINGIFYIRWPNYIYICSRFERRKCYSYDCIVLSCSNIDKFTCMQLFAEWKRDP